MTKFHVTVNRSQTFVIEAESVEEAHELCLDGELIDDEIIDDEIIDMFSTYPPEEDRP